MRIFAQITKVDEQKREVIGRAVQEVPDRADEIFDYASSRPYFEAWSKSFETDTDGKSLGNIRAMHGKVAAGKVTAIDFNDADKAIDIRAKIVDANEWSKVLEGVYTGFSIGGAYVGERIAEKIGNVEVKRYTANPSEISIVDSPCIPTAKFFEVVKADGAIAKVAFRPPELEVTGTDEQIAEFAEALKTHALTMSDAIAAVGAYAVAKIERAMADAMVETIAEMEKREFSADERKAAAKEGVALKDGSFPIKTAGDVANAVRAYGRAKDKAAAKAHIIRRAKALGASDKLPAAWTKGEKATGDGTLAKGMYNVQSFAECLSCIASLASGAQWELESEGDASPIPAGLRNWLADGIDLFQAMAAEEATELLAELKAAAKVPADDGVELAMAAATKVGALRKRLADPDLPVVELAALAKEHDEPITTAVLADVPGLVARIVAKAARSAATDAAHVQEAHDHLTAMGAACGAGKAASGDLQKAAAEASELTRAVERLTAEVEVLKRQPMPHKVLLRTVRRDDPDPGPAEVAKEAGIDDVPEGDRVRNADGSLDHAATLILWKTKQARARK